MQTYIALLRGINIGGHHLLPMRELAAILAQLGAREVRTYIQSGNAVFRCPDGHAADLAARLRAAIGERYGFQPHVLILAPDALARAVAGNPFPDAAADPNTLHLGFLAARPDAADLAKLARLKGASERFHLGDGVFYMHLPEGAGRSKLAAGAEQALGVPMTGRNWKTVCKLLDLAGIAAP